MKNDVTYTLITGACGGLGEAFCKLLVKTDNVFLTGRNAEKLERLKELLLLINPKAEIVCFKADLTNEKERAELFAFSDENGIRFSGYIAVAGADVQKAFVKYDVPKLIFQTRINFEANVALCLEVLKRRAENIKILCVSSISGTTPMPYFSVYSATKCALINFYSALRYEVENAKITVLAPGSIPTREDVKKDIQLQGFTGKLSSKSPDYVARKAIKALSQNKHLVIPGLFNKLVYLFEKIIPINIKCRYVAQKWGKKEKDAF